MQQSDTLDLVSEPQNRFYKNTPTFLIKSVNEPICFSLHLYILYRPTHSNQPMQPAKWQATEPFVTTWHTGMGTAAHFTTWS